MKKLLLYLMFSYILLQNSCGIFIKINKDDGVYIPPGIDSLTAVVSDSITNRLFVSESRKSKAQSLYDKAKENYEIADSLWIMLTSLSPDSCDSLEDKKKRKTDELTNKIYKRINKAENELKKAKKLNPYELSIKDLLAYLYLLYGNFSTDQEFYKKSIYELKEIILKEKCDHTLYDRLGQNYYKLKDWAKAYQNYKQAEKVLLETAFLNTKNEKKVFAGEGEFIETDSVDTDVLFRYVYFQAITGAKLYDTELALSLFKKAQQITPLPDQLKLVENYTKWIKWDEGNIAASEKKNIYLKLIDEKKYKEAKSGFEELIKELNTHKAKDEIGWQIAVIEYQFLDQQEKGCKRLFEIIKNIDIDETTGLPVDHDYKQYVTDCGTMFYKLGFQYKKQSKYKKAFKYFENAAQINWSGKWVSLLEIAKLSVHNPDKSLTIINQILSGNHNLNKSQHAQVLTLKLNALKRFGPERLEEIKDTYREIRSLQSRVN